ncbi:hypothetical protein Ccrd_000183 [Cynara cardunculus var. scolymus]|uniref:Sugar phosphate transporter domain-containing protein n=1 Tax=Cynara cardunculus var. scolymus TaxID=59895 RepID=A0A118JYN4_CYNCS|nr:hypothetical protein Ccrd_000183 [Cynara cardunculus var. scolymus]
MASLMSHLSLLPAKPSNISNFSSRISPTLALRTSQPVFLSARNSSEKRPVEFSGKQLRYCGWNQLLRPRCSVEIPVVKAAASADGGDREIEGFVSVVHLLVGVTYCLISWSIGLPKRAPINKDLLGVLTPVAACHALGHVMSNVSFAAVAVSFTHTIKGVSMASLTELSFNWLGFTSAMISNISFTYRSIYSKKAMIEGPKLMRYGFSDAIAKVGMVKFVSDLFWIGMFYHLYNQVATNTLERVAPLTHAVGNVLKRVFVIGFSIIVFEDCTKGGLEDACLQTN